MNKEIIIEANEEVEEMQSLKVKELRGQPKSRKSKCFKELCIYVFSFITVV